MKSLYLHIGKHKTGSSTIQFFLQRNRKVLNKFGYLYPGNSNAHHNLGNESLENKKFSEDRYTWEKTKNEIAKSKSETILLSSENFSSYPIIQNGRLNKLKETVKNYDCKVIVYIRRKDVIIESAAIQNLKGGKDYISQKKLRLADQIAYQAYLMEWIRVFGHKNIIVRPLEKSQIPDLLNDFLDCINFPKNERNKLDYTPNKNQRPNIEQVRALYHFVNWTTNKAGKPIFDQKKSKQLIDKLLNFSKDWKGDKSYRIFPYDESKKILEKEENQNNEFAKKYLNQNKLFFEGLEPYEHHSLSIDNMEKENLVSYLEFLANQTSIKI